MAGEIERKFPVCADSWRRAGEGTRYRQGYLLNSAPCSVRVRLSDAGAWLTIKGARVGLTRPKFEYAIPVGDAERMLATLYEGSLVEKTRYRVPYGAPVWKVDEFHGDNTGLVLAELELQHEAETCERPACAREEVGKDPRYYSGRLAKEPFSS